MISPSSPPGWWVKRVVLVDILSVLYKGFIRFIEVAEGL